MNYTVKFVVILGIVAVASFFTASVVIPEKNAVAPSRKSVSRASAPPALRGGDIPVVVADGKPADKPILVSGPGLAPAAHEALAPSAAPLGGAAAMAVAPPPPLPPPNAPVNAAKAAAPPAPATVATAPAAAPPADAKSATFSPKPEPAAPLETFASPTAVPVDKSLPPPNTMAARLNAELSQPKANAAPPAAAPAAAPTTVAAAAPPDTVVKKKTDPNAPLGYRLASTAVCAAVENRAPKGVADRFPKEAGAVYYFTHVVGATTDSAAVMHRWYREGKLIQTSILEIKSPNWRTHSKRNLTTVDEPAGNWRVEVLDRRSGKVLESASFVVE